MSFLILGLPRSRTYWLSKFLSHRDWHCGHEELRHMRSLEDVKSWLSQPNTGSAETAVAPWWRLLRDFAPVVKIVLVRRPVAEVFDSLARFDCGPRDELLAKLKRLDAKLDQIAHRWPDLISVKFAHLNSFAVCKRVFEFCLPYRLSGEWWSAFNASNLQADVPAIFRHAVAFAPQMAKLAEIASHATIAGMSRRVCVETEGVTLQEEAFDVWFADARALFAEHLVRVGEAPSNLLNKNIALMRELDARGAMQIVTARSNGRMFGYLATLISPSFEFTDGNTAVDTAEYSSPDMPGIGLKLKRFAIGRLREKGVREAWFRAGTRGDGPRMGNVYRRLGASLDGQLYRLDLRTV